MYEYERIKVIPTWMPVKDVEDNEKKITITSRIHGLEFIQS